MEFKSKFSEDEIYERILNTFSRDDINFLVMKNLIVRSKYGNKELKKNKIIDREKAIKAIVDSYKVNTVVKRTIDEIWILIAEPLRKKLNLYDSVKDMKVLKHIDEGEDKILICSVLWTSENIEENKLGDEIYEDYKKRKEVQKEDEKLIEKENLEKNKDKKEKVNKSEKKGVRDLKKKTAKEDLMDLKKKVEKIEKKSVLKKVKKEKVLEKSVTKENNKDEEEKDFMSMPIGEVIESIGTFKEKIQGLEEKLVEKNKEIEELKKQLKSGDNKVLAREVKKINKSFEEGLIFLKEENNKLRKSLEENKKENEKLTKEIMKQNKIIEKVQKGNNKEIKDMLLESQNAIKGPIIESNKKIVEELKILIRDEMKNIKIKGENSNDGETTIEFTKAIDEIPKDKKVKIEKAKEKKVNGPSFEDDLFNEEDFEDIFK